MQNALWISVRALGDPLEGWKSPWGFATSPLGIPREMLLFSWGGPSQILTESPWELLWRVLGKLVQTVLRLEVLVWLRPSLGGYPGGSHWSQPWGNRWKVLQRPCEGWAKPSVHSWATSLVSPCGGCSRCFGDVGTCFGGPGQLLGGFSGECLGGTPGKTYKILWESVEIPRAP